MPREGLSYEEKLAIQREAEQKLAEQQAIQQQVITPQTQPKQQMIPYDIRGTKDYMRPYTPIAWTTDPITGINLADISSAQKDTSGKAYGWTEWDIYNIVSYGFAVKGVSEIGYQAGKSAFLGSKYATPFMKAGLIKPRLAPQEVGQAFLGGSRAVGLAELRAEEASWALMQTPKTAGVYISKIVGETTIKKSLPHLIFREGALTVGYLREPLYFIQREATFTPLVSQTQLTRMGIQPYFPRGGLVQRVITTPKIIIPPILQPFYGKKAIWQPTYSLEKEKFRPQQLIERIMEPKQRLKIPPLLAPLISPRLKYPQPQITLPKLIQPTIPKQAVITIPKIPIPTVTIPKIVFPPIFNLGGGVSGGGGAKNLFGKWFKKQQRIKTPQQMLQTFFGSPTRRRRHK